MYKLCMVLANASFASGSPVRAGDVVPVKTLPCFPGAYYRKAVSGINHWTGIEVVVKLPDPEYDNSRLRPNGRPLDNASVYIGGRSGEQEIDCGVNWEIIKESDGTIGKIGKAFRPFWRNEKWGSGPAKPAYYYYPGDLIRMKVENAEDGKLVMRIDLLARAGEPAAEVKPVTAVDESTAVVASKKNRRPHTAELSTVPADSISSFTTVFAASAFSLGGLQQYKRVNGLDQSGNEGNPVQPTKTRIKDAVWQEAWLLRGHERVPMTPERFTDMRCPDPKHITVSPVGLSGETVTLTRSPTK